VVVIKLKPKQWVELENQLSTEYPRSVMIIRYKMKEVLGFTVRKHRQWLPSHDADSKGRYQDWVMLDFYNEPMETFFRIKYAEFLGQ